MLVLHLATTFLLYYVARQLSGKKEVGIISVLIYSLSPLGIYFQRRVLLDNIMTFWVFLSIALIIKKNLKISSSLLSAIFFGFAVLTKENAIFFIPLYLYLIYVNSDSHNRKFTMINFIVAAVSVISTYFLYALLKNEFFPVGFLGNESDHVSMLTSFKWQMVRGTSLPFWRKGSDFYGNLQDWLSKDKYIVVLGTASMIAATLLSIKYKYFRAPTIFALLFVFFLIRGGLVIGFYIVPLIPIFALLIAQVWQFIVEKLSMGNKLTYRGGLFVSCLIIFGLFLSINNGEFTRNETEPQISAITWVKENVPEDAYIVIDNYMYVDLKEKGYVNDKTFPNADWFWKISYDPEVKEGKYGGDFKKVEYITLSHEMLKQVGEGTQNDLKKALNDSKEIITWSRKTTSYLDFNSYISTNGDWMSIFKRKNLEDIYLADSWKNYKERFIHSYGQVIDPSNNTTTSEGQAYAMLRAVWANDEQAFDGVWTWTKDHLQHRDQDKLISWWWGDEHGRQKVLDANSASDADEDIVLALIFASSLWRRNDYVLDALSLMNDVWNKEVVQVGDRYLLTSSAESARDDVYLVNPSYFSPASYRIFANVDSTHDWNKLADDSYYFLDSISKDLGNGNGIPPNWVVVGQDGSIGSAKDIVTGNPDDYGYDAFRSFWRVALDYYWFSSTDAFAYLKTAEPFFTQQWGSDNGFDAIYALSGKPLTDYSSKSTISGPLSVFLITNPKLAQVVFDKEYSQFVYGNNENDSLGYYDANWLWFSTALYLDKLPNLWKNS
jgi:endoglucanase